MNSTGNRKDRINTGRQKIQMRHETDRFEFINSFGGGMTIELLDWRYSADTSELAHNGIFRLNPDGAFVCQMCTCVNRRITLTVAAFSVVET